MERLTAANLALALATLAGCGRLEGPTLTGAATADDAFYAHLSTSPSARGTLIAHGDRMGVAVAVAPTPLAPGPELFLHAEAINSAGPAAFSASSG